MTLRDAIEAVLRGVGRPIRSREIAENGAYVRREGSQVPRGDANDTKQVFRVDRGLVSLAAWDRATTLAGAAERRPVPHTVPALTVLVCSPRLLDAECEMLAQMRTVNNACRYAEVAG